MGALFSAICGVNDWFWHESHWFPTGINWTMLKTTSETEKLPDFSDLRLPIYYAFIVLVIRIIFEWSIARPLGRFCGIVDTESELSRWFKNINLWFRQKFQRAQAKTLTANGSVDHCDNVANGEINAASCSRSRSKSGSARINKLLVQQKSTLDKFAESCWRFTYYLLIFVYGAVVLWNKPWLWDGTHFWHGYPFQPISRDIWWYYMIELSFYWSLTFSQFVDVHRKDFWVNFIHHIATILLMCFSWADSFVRPGTLVLIIHDAADFWMEAAKMARYCNRNRLCNFFFMIFTLVWFITRVGIYPYRIIYSALIEAPALLGFYAAYYVFNVLLLLLFLLHIFWSIMILRIVIMAITSGEPDDVRSDDEGEEESEEEMVELKPIHGQRTSVTTHRGATSKKVD